MVPTFVIGMRLESPIVPAPMMVLWLVKASPEPKMQVLEAIESLPEPVKVDGWFSSTQALLVKEIVPVLLIVPLDAQQIEVLDGELSRISGWVYGSI
jgi:hypothetical protein